MLPTSISLEGLLLKVIFIKNLMEDFYEKIDKYSKTNGMGKFFLLFLNNLKELESCF